MWLDPWRWFLTALSLGAEVQGVVALRTLRLAAGGPQALVEAHRMVAEKVAAFAAAEVAGAAALAHGASLPDAAVRAFRPVRHCLDDNFERLSRPRR
ncbi:hypothetical protein A33M_1567 [Rhodovulum sp. PH10]|uniref:hypothetical protein n=1 Tax=Rhodovulum sp. PH10 TaxID=1187851 RepID=UPI00027C2703|nr:hypothetical protein [Rhodovulum sp. PH10]EJW13668.1 hypothetical protein A33M_1567 [Rhodovulum sp. PH10]